MISIFIWYSDDIFIVILFHRISSLSLNESRIGSKKKKYGWLLSSSLQHFHCKSHDCLAVRFALFMISIYFQQYNFQLIHSHFETPRERGDVNPNFGVIIWVIIFKDIHILSIEKNKWKKWKIIAYFVIFLYYR